MNHADLLRLVGSAPAVAVPYVRGRTTCLPATLFTGDDGIFMANEESVEAVALAAAPYLTRGVELVELLGALVDAMVKQLSAEKGTLYLVDGARGRITSVITDVPGGISLAIGQGLAGAVAEDGTIINVSDANQDPRFH